MVFNKLEQHQYVMIYRINAATNFYVNTSTSIPELASILWNKFNSFGLELKPKKRWLTFLPAIIIKMIRVSRIIGIFIIRKLNSKRDLIYSDKNGQVAIKRQSNDYMSLKLFDLHEKVVVTYDKGNDKFYETVDNLKKLACNSFAPNIYWVDYNKKCYTEEYIDIAPAQKWDEGLKLASNFIIAIVNSSPIYYCTVECYLSSLEYTVSDKYFFNPLVHDKAKYILNSFNYSYDKLSEHCGEKLLISFSHGDPSRKNILPSKGKTIGIDWEHSKYRPLLYDLLFLLVISRKFCFNNNSFTDFKKEIDESFELFTRKINCEIDLSSADIERYFHCFNLEYLQWNINKNMVYLNESDAFNRLDRGVYSVNHIKKCESFFFINEGGIKSNDFTADSGY